MAIYRDYILPWIIDRVLARSECRQLRQRVVQGLGGTVLEIGFGSGLNLPHYPSEVRRILAVDPAVFGRKLAAKRLGACPVPVEFIGLNGEEIPLEAGSVDSALSTWTLCSIPDLPAALGEIRRVLKPGGRFHFLEHGLSPEAGVARWQHRLNSLQRVIAGGCQLILPIDELVKASGLTITSLEKFYMKGPRLGSYMYQGVAVTPESVP